MRVHPTFDPNTRTWWTDDGVSAKSVRELASKVAPLEIADYYPHGLYGTFQQRYRADEPVEVLAGGTFKVPSGKIVSAEELRETMLAEPLPEPVIIEEVGLFPASIERHPPRERYRPKRGTSEPIELDLPVPLLELEPVRLERRPTPTRKYNRVAPGQTPVPWTAAEDAKLRKMFSQKASDAEIARALGKTKNSVIGHRHRLKLYRSK